MSGVLGLKILEVNDEVKYDKMPRIAIHRRLCYTDNIHFAGRFTMEISKEIKELRLGCGMNRKEFSEHTGIPVRTLEDWEAGRRTPPEYIPRLIAYQMKYERLMKGSKDE